MTAPSSTIDVETIDAFSDLGVRALITTRAAGDFAFSGSGPIGEVLARWQGLRVELAQGSPIGRFATATQVHGAHVIEYRDGWEGWLRADAADGHFSRARGIGFAVSVADCVPVFVAHPSGAIALLHAGWRGTAAGIVPRAVAIFAAHGLAPPDLRIHLGPAICGRCYEVGPEVIAQVTGQTVGHPTRLDLRGVLADQSRGAGVREVSTSALCTRCDGERLYSHRAGDPERQVAAIVAP